MLLRFLSLLEGRGLHHCKKCSAGSQSFAINEIFPGEWISEDLHFASITLWARKHVTRNHLRAEFCCVRVCCGYHVRTTSSEMLHWIYNLSIEYHGWGQKRPFFNTKPHSPRSLGLFSSEFHVFGKLKTHFRSHDFHMTLESQPTPRLDLESRASPLSSRTWKSS